MNFKKIVKATAVLAIASCTGCASIKADSTSSNTDILSETIETIGDVVVPETDGTTSTIFVSVKHANAAEPSFSNTILNAWIQASIESGGSVGAIEVDGAPYPYMLYTIPSEFDGTKYKDLPSSTKQEIIDAYTEAIYTDLDSAVPQTDEVDILEALRKSVLLAKEAGGDHQVLIIDGDAIQTIGYVDMSEDAYGHSILEEDPNEVVQSLKEQQALPDLSCYEQIIWLNPGATGGEQEQINQYQIYTLEQLWSAVLKACGYTGEVDFEETLTEENTDTEGWPKVTTISAEDSSIQINISLDQSEVEFAANSAEFADPAKAEAEIAEAAELLKAYPKNQIYILGFTASGDSEAANALSQERAEAIHEELIKDGVSEAQIAGVKGLGFENWWHVDGDLNVDGTYNEEVAAQNRRVLLIDVNHADAVHISE